MDILPEYDGAGEQKVEHRNLQSSNVHWKKFAVGDGRPAAGNKIIELSSLCSIKQHIYLGLKSILYSRPILPLPHCYTILQYTTVNPNVCCSDIDCHWGPNLVSRDSDWVIEFIESDSHAVYCWPTCTSGPWSAAAAAAVPGWQLGRPPLSASLHRRHSPLTATTTT